MNGTPSLPYPTWDHPPDGRETVGAESAYPHSCSYGQTSRSTRLNSTSPFSPQKMVRPWMRQSARHGSYGTCSLTFLLQGAVTVSPKMSRYPYRPMCWIMWNVSICRGRSEEHTSALQSIMRISS